MGNFLSSSQVQELREELARTEQALQKHLESAAHELEAEQRRRKAVEAEVAAAAAKADSLRGEIAKARGDEAAALEAAAAARKAHDEHALLVKRILTAQQKYGVKASWPGVPSAEAADAQAHDLAHSPSPQALARADAASARLSDVGGGAVRTALAECEDDGLCALLWPGPLGDLSLSVRGSRTFGKVGLVLGGQGGAEGGKAGPPLSASPFDTARLAAGVLHRLPFGPAAVGLSAVYCPLNKSIDEGALSLLVGRAACTGGSARAAAAAAAANGSGVALSHVLASLDHGGEMAVGGRWLIGDRCRLEAKGCVDVNSKRLSKVGAHITFTL